MNADNPQADRGAGQVRLKNDERLSLAQAVSALTNFPCPRGGNDLSGVPNQVEQAVARIIAARLVDIEDERSRWQHLTEARRYARGSGLLARAEAAEAALAARQSDPDATERVEWGVRTVTEKDSWDSSEGSRALAELRRDSLTEWLTVKDGPNGFANGKRFVGAHLIRRTITTYEPVVGEWSEVSE